jgi:hypothetical protein
MSSLCGKLSASPYKNPKNLSRLGLGPLGGGTTLPEAVLESSVDVLEVGHSAGTAEHDQWTSQGMYAMTYVVILLFAFKPQL